MKIASIMGTDFWKEAINKEMINVQPAFEFRDSNQLQAHRLPHGF
jgi:hypothetical protein